MEWVLNFTPKEIDEYIKLYVEKILEIYPQEKIIVLDIIHAKVLFDNNDIRYFQEDTEIGNVS